MKKCLIILNLLLSVIIKYAFCVPPMISDRILSDLKEMKMTISHVETHLERLSDQSGQITSSMFSSSATLATIDANVRNIQERAHVWDTFQLHVSAWNDQLFATERKLDILSEGMQSLQQMETKLNGISNMELLMENLSKKLEETNAQIIALKQTDNGNRQHSDNIFGEFANRGVLSTLKQIERKIDRLQYNSVRQSNKNSQGEATIIDETPNSQNIKCYVPKLEDLLKDILSKVDIIFDKVNAKEDFLDGLTSDYIEDDNVGNVRLDTDLKLLMKQVVKRINSPCNQNLKLLENISEKIEHLKPEIRVSSCTENSSSYELTHMLALQLNGLFNEHKEHFGNSLKEYCQSNITVNQNTIQDNKKMEPSLEPEIPECAVGSECMRLRDRSYITLDNYGNTIAVLPNCSTGYQRIYYTDIKDSTMKVVRCHHDELLNSSWIQIQARHGLNKHPLDFNRTWEEYRVGFEDNPEMGLILEEYWIGNDLLHTLTKNNDTMLRIDLEDYSGNSAWAEYGYFSVGPAEDDYRLAVGAYRGNATDSLSYHNGAKFSTYDRNNDDAPECCPCALSYGSGWWFKSCFESNLNGIYRAKNYELENYDGIIWEHWLGNYSLKFVRMVIKTRTSDDGFSNMVNDNIGNRGNENNEEVPDSTTHVIPASIEDPFPWEI